MYCALLWVFFKFPEGVFAGGFVSMHYFVWNVLCPVINFFVCSLIRSSRLGLVDGNRAGDGAETC